jgi:hypothetical protein
MTQTNKNDRSPKDLSVPETMKIAALLAELMPPGVEMGSGSTPVSLQADAGESVDDSPSPIHGPPALQMEDLDELAENESASSDDLSRSPTPPPAAWSALPGKSTRPVRDTAPPAAPAAWQNPPSRPVPSAPAPAPIQEVTTPPVIVLPKLSEIRTPTGMQQPVSTASPASQESKPQKAPIQETQPAPAAIQAEDTTVTKLMERTNRSNNAEFLREASAVSKAAPAKIAGPKSAPLDLDLIPLGSLTVAGYFSLVNWKNDPRRIRHPKRADYGLDEQTLAQASRNPFYVVGQPRRPEDRSVSEVLAEIVWE